MLILRNIKILKLKSYFQKLYKLLDQINTSILESLT